ncbi:hypothetical protein [Microbacterium sp. 1.5R]|uniref:hypothetical protein n=1 Tax=Microbacterium sp. 1.5R TaxID=1916917 RepID=UPI0021B42471|nr:hypothetical protein [Microbacterium sp. 1.5R]
MNDKTPNQDHSPEPEDAARATHETTPLSSPDAPTVPVAPASDSPADHATVPIDPTPAADPAPAAAQAEPAPAATNRRKRGLLIGGGVLAALLLAGGGVAVGAAIGDEIGDDDDRPGSSDGPRDDEGAPGQGQQGGRPGEDRGDGRDDDGPADGPDGGPAAGPGNGPATGIGTASADELVDIANTARGAADGDVTSIDAKRDGAWEVELTTATGGETEVRVDREGKASVVSTKDGDDDDDTAPAYVLDEAAIRALVAAALDEADGLITDLGADDDASSPYDAELTTGDRRSIDIDFGTDFAVVGTDSDD